MMVTLNLSEDEAEYFDYWLASMRDGIDPDTRIADIHDKLRDARGVERRGRHEEEMM